jgi:hypothetical protein
MALTDRQRKAILERDKYTCRHPDKSFACGGKLYVHHISCQRWSRDVLHLEWEEIDNPVNLITLCRNHHVGHPRSVHPDNQIALEAYRKGNKKAFIEMAEARNAKQERGEKYWNDEYDEEMLEYARKATMRAAHKGWTFPWKKEAK